MQLRLNISFLSNIIKAILLLAISMHAHPVITKEKIMSWLFCGYIQANMTNNIDTNNETVMQKIELYADVILDTFTLLSNQGILEQELKQMAIILSQSDYNYSQHKLNRIDSAYWY
jgi:hypothetical protein